MGGNERYPVHERVDAVPLPEMLKILDTMKHSGDTKSADG